MSVVSFFASGPHLHQAYLCDTFLPDDGRRTCADGSGMGSNNNSLFAILPYSLYLLYPITIYGCVPHTANICRNRCQPTCYATSAQHLCTHYSLFTNIPLPYSSCTFTFLHCAFPSHATLSLGISFLLYITPASPSIPLYTSGLTHVTVLHHGWRSWTPFTANTAPRGWRDKDCISGGRRTRRAGTGMRTRRADGERHHLLCR